MHTLICGSLAYDNILVFPDRFKNHILPDRIHALNVCFFAPEMRREYGGCAGNIAYNLQMLGGAPLIMAAAGDDFGPYARRLDGLGLSRAHVREVPGRFTAQAFITTDLDDNQITAFHPGAMDFAHENRVADARDVGLAIVAPDGRAAMLQHAADLARLGTPFVFDPGQGLPMFNGEELMAFVEMADYVAVNDYEAHLLAERTGRSFDDLAKLIKALVVTLGAEGSRIYADGRVFEVPAARASEVVDPTGCGDAYRAGLLYGIARGWPWQATGQLAAYMGALKIASRGAQNHRAGAAEIFEGVAREFGTRLPA